MEKGKLLSPEELRKLKVGDELQVFTRTFGLMEAKVESTSIGNNCLIILSKSGHRWLDIPRNHYNSLENLENPIEIYSHHEPKQYTGVEILQMIKDGQLKEGAELLGYMPEGEQDGIMRIRDSGNGRLYIENIEDSDKEEVDAWDLINMTFSIKEKEYVTFDEARRSGKRFKHKDWGEYHSLDDVLRKMCGCSDDYKNYLFDSKVWIIKE